MTVPEALSIARMTDRELHEAGYAWADRARHDALDALASHVEGLREMAKPGAWARLVAEVDARQAPESKGTP